jgi:kinesin family protein 3/17
MMACVSPNEEDYQETISTLMYASRAKTIQNHVSVNKDYETTELIKLKARIADLESELKIAREVCILLKLLMLI